MTVRLLALVAILAGALAPAPAASSASHEAAASIAARPIVVVGANQSANWAGYVQGILSKGVSFHSVSAEWVVPRAQQRTPGEAEYSSTWIGIGGGCLDTACTAADVTLIQAGIGHDIDTSGKADYYAWWEAIPGPLIRTKLAVGRGDRVRVEIAEDATVPQLWTIRIRNVTRRDSFSITLPYVSTHATVEWILETPVVIDNSGKISIGPMPSVSNVRFRKLTANGTNPRLQLSEQMKLVGLDGAVIAFPSAPGPTGQSFNDCAFRQTCPAPRR